MEETGHGHVESSEDGVKGRKTAGVCMCGHDKKYPG
jgi:hypothetical protein